MTLRRLPLFVLLAAWLAAVMVFTLVPSGSAPPLTLEAVLCIGCGSRGTADIILNWMLFLPGGALAAIAMGQRRAVIAALCFAIVIETLQLGIAGRYPALQDLVLNTLGAWSGALLVRQALGRRGQRLLALLIVVVWLSPLFLLIPLGSSHELHGMWTPLRNGVRYEGRVLAASVDGLPIPSWIVQNRAAVDRAIVERSRIELSLEVGPQPSAFARVFQIVDGRLEVVTIGALGEDLILNGKNPARVLGLDQPDARWPGALEGVIAGDTVTVVVDRNRSSVCMSVDERERCHLAPSLGDGWGHLFNVDGGSSWMRMLLSIGWSIGLGLVLGATSATARSGLIRGFGLAATGLVACTMSPDVRPDVLHAALLAGGSFLGAGMRPTVDRLWSSMDAAEDAAD